MARRLQCGGDGVDEIQIGKWLEELVGQSEVFLAMTQKIPVIAATDVAVLIRGETGTGKELCARAIHYLSPRRGGPFVVENCGRLPADLIANEFFGHEIGAFTGASGVTKGLIGRAEAGTLVLDEVDSLSVAAQAVLLRFLQDRLCQRLGGEESRIADVRVLASTNRELRALVERGLFRGDLYYRLKVTELVLPPLRQRSGDIELLARHFVEKYAREFKKPLTGLAPDCVDRLHAYYWPGNVRELEDVIIEAVIFSKSPLLQSDELNLPAPPAGGQNPLTATFKVAKAIAVENFEVAYLSQVLKSAGYNISQAAREAGMRPGAMWRLLRKHRLLPHLPEGHQAR